MRIQAKLLGVALCALGAVACGDGEAGAAGNGGSGGSGGTGGEGSTVTGVVVTRGIDGGVLIPGAIVGVFDTSISATTDSNGAFALQDVPNGDVFFTTAADGNWGIVDYYEVPTETVGGVELGVVSDAKIAGIEEALSRTVGETDSIVIISFYAGAEGGETGTISATSDPPVTFDLDELPVAQEGIIADDSGYGELLFTGVDPAEGPITATVAGASGVTICEVDESPGTTYPLVAKSVTIVYAICEPAP